MELKDYSINELKAELSRREMDDEENNANTLPENYLPYKDIRSIELYDENMNIQYFYAHVDDGCEGVGYLIQYRYKDWNSSDDSDILIADTVKHHAVLLAQENEYDANVYDVQLQELGRYGISFIEIDGTKRKEEN